MKLHLNPTLIILLTVLMRLQALWSMSSNSDKVCESIISTGLHADMLSNLVWESLSAQSLNDPKSGAKRDFVEAHIATLHNVVRKTNTARTALRQLNAFNVIQKFRNCSEFPVRKPTSYVPILSAK